MSKEWIILILSWVASIILLLWKIPKEKKREAQIVFLFAQTLGWLYVFIQSYFNNLVFPVREFPKATNMLVSLHFIIYPTFLVFFTLFYPNTNQKRKIFLHYLLFISIHQVYEILLTRYTDLIKSKDWEWYLGVVTKCVVYYLCIHFYRWFWNGFQHKQGSSDCKTEEGL
jgi:hypothetical protein